MDAGRAAPGGHARIAEVTRVPADEALAEPGVCPPSGVRVSADDADSGHSPAPGPQGVTQPRSGTDEIAPEAPAKSAVLAFLELEVTDRGSECS